MTTASNYNPRPTGSVRSEPAWFKWWMQETGRESQHLRHTFTGLDPEDLPLKDRKKWTAFRNDLLAAGELEAPPEPVRLRYEHERGDGNMFDSYMGRTGPTEHQ